MINEPQAPNFNLLFILQKSLWFFQSAIWHSFEQYRVIWQALQCKSLGFPVPRHRWQFSKPESACPDFALVEYPGMSVSNSLGKSVNGDASTVISSRYATGNTGVSAMRMAWGARLRHLVLVRNGPRFFPFPQEHSGDCSYSSDSGTRWHWIYSHVGRWSHWRQRSANTGRAWFHQRSSSP